MLPEIGLAKGACTLWEADEFLDYTIEVEDEEFKVHKLVMASVSDYFRAMLTGDMVESREDKVRLEGLSSLAVKNMIEYIYTGQFGSSKASAEERLTCAMYLQIPAAVKVCTAALCEEVDNKNCFHILTIFKTYAIKHGMEHTVKFIKLNFEDILKDLKSEDLTYEEFVCLLECWGKPECQLFVTAMQWLKKDHEHRKEHLKEIMSHMRFCLMSPTELASMKEMDIISDSDGPWHELIEKALRYHDLPTHQKVLEESEQAKVRTEPSPVCFGVHPSVSGQLFTIRECNSLTRYNTVNPVFADDCDRDEPLTYLHINNFYIACISSGEHDVKCSIFDPRTLTWSDMAPMTIPREKCALVYHENHLYALGGSDRRDDSHAATDVIEKYDFRANTWSVLTSRMPVAMSIPEAFSVGDCIYVPGGVLSHHNQSRMVHCFDPKSGEWSGKATPPPLNYTNRIVVEIDGEKVIAGIYDDLKVHYYKASVDQWLVYDRSVPTKVKGDDYYQGRSHATWNAIFLVDYDGAEKSASICEKWTFGKDGVQVDTIADRRPPEWSYDHITNFCALLAIP